MARTARPASLVSTTLLAGLATCGVVCVLALVWLIRSGPGYMGYGAALLAGFFFLACSGRARRNH